jgi:hypothetical protein
MHIIRMHTDKHKRICPNARMQPKGLSLELGSAPTIEPARSEAAIVQPPPLPHWPRFRTPSLIRSVTVLPA